MSTPSTRPTSSQTQAETLKMIVELLDQLHTLQDNFYGDLTFINGNIWLTDADGESAGTLGLVQGKWKYTTPPPPAPQGTILR